MLKNPKFQAFFFAFLAAIFNAFVGIFSVFLFKKGFMSSEVAFYKCFVASVVLFAILIYLRKFSHFCFLLFLDFLCFIILRVLLTQVWVWLM